VPALENVAIGIRRSRRNLIKVGAIGGSAIFAGLIRPRLTAAQDNQRRDDENRQWDHDYRRWNRGGNWFMKGTTIETAEGDRKIEGLAVGDLLPTVFGGICPIQWIGYYSYKKSNKAPWVKDVPPVRVARSALGPNMPRADLYITKNHALLIDGVLVTAGSLINGMTITLDDARENNGLKFFHIKLARHNVI
jgi:Hint domain